MWWSGLARKRMLSGAETGEVGTECWHGGSLYEVWAGMIAGVVGEV